MHLTPAVQSIRDALPTLRHARMLLAMTADLLGDAARIADDALYRREGDVVVPWHVLRLQADAAAGPGAARRRLRGLGPGSIELWDGVDHVTIRYGEDGGWAALGWSGDPERHAGVVDVLEKGRGNRVELLAEHVAALDVARHGPGRVLAHSPEPLDAWCCALDALRAACFDGRIPGTARWAAADDADVTAGATREAALDAWRGGAPAILSLPPLPPPHPLAWGRWVRLLDPCGVTAHALVRDHEGGFLLIGEALLDETSPLRIQALVEARESRRRDRRLASARGKPRESVAITYELLDGRLIPCRIDRGDFDPADLPPCACFRDRVLHVRRPPNPAARRR